MRVTCLVDNSVAQGEMWAEAGLSLLVEAEGGRVLFDLGESGTVLRHNAKALGLDLSTVDAVVFSHGHTDHTGGLEPVAGLLSGKPLVAHPDVFRERFGGREHRSIGLDQERARVIGQALRVTLDAEPRQVVPGVWTTGEIRDRPFPESRGRGEVRVGDGYAPEPCRDDLSLVLTARDGIVLLLGCAHAGVLNILAAVRQRYSAPLLAVIGGTHLGGASQETLREVARQFQASGSPRLYFNHCTGIDALFYLRYLMPDLVRPFGAGSKVEFPEGAMA